VAKQDLASTGKEFQGSAMIADCSFVAYYNWIEDGSGIPTIAIPGKNADIE
jgi:hypothetical protein